jgi:hypothetical protein
MAFLREGIGGEYRWKLLRRKVDRPANRQS